MNTSTLIASLLTVGSVLGLVIFRLLWAGPQVAAAARLGLLPKSWRRWLFDEHENTSN
jgi:hypothetical protein